MKHQRLLRDDAGATAIEYALIAACIAMVVMGGITKVGGEVADQFSDIAAQIDGVGSKGTTLPTAPIKVRPLPGKPTFPRYKVGYDPLPKGPSGMIRAVSSFYPRSGATCSDGSSSLATGRGACSHHGGVAKWKY